MKIISTDTEEERKAKYHHNSLVITQKPYFFIYLYKNLMKDYKTHQKGFEMIARKQYRKNLTKLLTGERTHEETNFLRRYRKYSPVIETPCVMNLLCKQVERVDNSIKWDKNQKNILMDFTDFSSINKKLVDKVYDLVKLYNSKKSVRGLQILVENEGLNDEAVNDLFKAKIYTHKDNVREKIRNLFDNEQDMLNHIVFMSNFYNMKLDNVWEIMGDYIVDCIPWDKTFVVIKDEGGQEYLGNKLSLKEVD